MTTSGQLFWVFTSYVWYYPALRLIWSESGIRPKRSSIRVKSNALRFIPRYMLMIVWVQQGLEANSPGIAAAAETTARYIYVEQQGTAFVRSWAGRSCLGKVFVRRRFFPQVKTALGEQAANRSCPRFLLGTLRFTWSLSTQSSLEPDGAQVAMPLYFHMLSLSY